MTVADALLTMIALALLAGALAFAFADPVADRRRAEEMCEAKRQAEARDARVRADRAQARAAADYGFDLAEQQLAQHRAMPSREQVLAAAGDGRHDWLGVPDAQRALEVALLADMFCREARPPVAADTDPDAAAHRW
ncbi:MAG TPA: hypothetical protein VLT58_12295 [Polyangia bacterium]|nr:hypothetical protein [Polyangia bacterium]